MTSLNPALFARNDVSQFLSLVPDTATSQLSVQVVTQKPNKNQSQLTKMVAELIPTIGKETKLSPAERLHFAARVETLNLELRHSNTEIDNNFWITLLHVILLILTFGGFSYRETLKVKEIEFTLTAFFPETTDWSDVAANLPVEEYLLFAKGVSSKNGELLSLLKLGSEQEVATALNSSDALIAASGKSLSQALLNLRDKDLKAVLIKAPAFLQASLQEQISSLNHLFKNSSESEFRKSLQKVFASMPTSAVATISADSDVSSLVSLLSKEQWDSLPKELFFSFAKARCLPGSTPTTSRQEFRELYAKHDPQFSSLYQLAEETEFSLLSALFQGEESLPFVATIPIASLTPFLISNNPKSISPMVRLLSKEQLQALPNNLLLKGAANLSSQHFCLPASNTAAWIFELLEKGGHEALCALIDSLRILIDSLGGPQEEKKNGSTILKSVIQSSQSAITFMRACEVYRQNQTNHDAFVQELNAYCQSLLPQLDDFKPILAKQRDFATLAIQDQMKALIHLHYNADDDAERTAILKVAAFYPTQILVEVEPSIRQDRFQPFLHEKLWEAFSKERFFARSKAVFGEMVKYTGTKWEEEAKISEAKFQELYLKHDPTLDKFDNVAQGNSGFYFLTTLCPIKTPEEETASLALAERLGLERLKPFLEQQSWNAAYAGRLLSKEAISNLSEEHRSNVVEHLFPRGFSTSTRPHANDPNLFSWLSVLLEKNDRKNLLKMVSSLANVQESAIIFIKSSPEAATLCKQACELCLEQDSNDKQWLTHLKNECAKVN